MIIITAEEFLKSTELIVKFDNSQGCILEEELPKLMIEFAKLHVEEALKNFLQEIEIQRCLYHHPPILFINKDSIKNAYSLNNIK